MKPTSRARMLKAMPKRYQHMADMNWDTAREQWHQGTLSQADWEAYNYAWMNAAFRYSTPMNGYVDRQLQEHARKEQWMVFWARIANLVKG